jgi:pSer/pThr/pTyr-binding forkhead associated (FHA) protein
LLLLPALAWFHLRFASLGATLTPEEVGGMLAYVALCGWGLPLAMGIAYLLFAPSGLRRTEQSRAALGGRAGASAGPAPFVFDADTPWGWLEHRNGRFQGQRLALKRAVVTLGRGEENDIWLDDDLASRYHAELLFQEGQVYVSDCQSLNGVFVNGRRVRGSLPLRSGDRLEIGRHRFLFELALPRRPGSGQDDPLLHHLPRPVRLLKDEAAADLKEALTVTPPPGAATTPLDVRAVGASGESLGESLRERTENPHTPAPVVAPPSLANRWEHILLICGGELAGRRFVCAAPVLTIGRDPSCELAIDDVSLAPRHALLLSRPEGLYVQDLTGGRASSVNGEPLTAPRLLRAGDRLYLGILPMQYLLQPAEQAPPTVTPMPTAVPERPPNGPRLLRLPMRPPVHPPDSLMR